MRRISRPTFSILLVVAWVLAALATAASAQDWKGRGRVQGLVTAKDSGEPIAGVSVTLRMQGQPDAGPEPILTNKKGRWSYLGLAGGLWNVLIEHAEYVTSEGAVRVSEFERGQTIETSLRPLKELIDQEMAKQAAELKARLEEANRLLGEQRFAEARTEFEAALETVDEASKPMVLIAIARTHYAEENSAGTEATLNQALAIDPDNVEALRLLSSLLVSEGRTEEAQQYIARLPTDEKLDPNALLNVGIEKYNAGDLEGALEEFDTVVESYADFAEAYYYRGLAHLGLTNNEPARADLEKFLELAPDHAKAGEARQFLEYLGSQ